MEVADQMQDEFQRDNAFFGIGARVGEFGHELLDLIDDTSLRRTIRGKRGGWQQRMPEASCVKVRIGEFDIDEMPAPGLIISLPGVPIRIPISIRPGGGARDVMCSERVRVGGEHAGDLRPNRSLEKSISDQSDDFVAFIAPGERVAARHGDRTGE
jgi:hypothetical protein